MGAKAKIKTKRAQNYVEQLTAYLDETVKYILKMDKKDPFVSPIATVSREDILHDVKLQNEVVELAARSPCFELPYNGVIFNDGLKGIEDIERLSLPYPCLTLVFDRPTPWGEYLQCVIILIQTEEEITTVAWLKNPLRDKGVKGWGYCDYAVSMYRDRTRLIGKHKPDRIVEFYTSLPYPALSTINHNGKEPDVTTRNVEFITTCTLEFLEALSCSNVEIESVNKVDPEVNKRRIQYGLTPYIETKRLVLKLPQGRTEINRPDDEEPNTESHRNSPRQHLRRGHIRRLEDGRKIWINSCVVGDPSRGRINKSYTVVNSGLAHLL